MYLGTSIEYSHDGKIRQVKGVYNLDKAMLENPVSMKPPVDSDCEKNWIPIPETDTLLYSWNPLRLGHVEGDELKFDKEIQTPWFFQHLRGSAVPILVQNERWCLVHYVKYSTPRKYFHCIVVLDRGTYVPKRISLPFVFREQGIEYCLSMTLQKKEIEFIFSSWDDNPMITRAELDAFEWIQV
jgi:hypothetical protein